MKINSLYIHLSLGVLTLNGCAVLSAATGIDTRPSVTVEESKEAIKNNDYPKLQDMCLDKINIDSNVANYRSDTCVAAIKIAREKEDIAFLKPLCGRRKESFGQRFNGACPAMHEIALAKNDTATLESLCQQDKYDLSCQSLNMQKAFTDLAQPDCSTLKAKVVEARNDFLKSDKVPAKDYAKVVTALAKCKEDQYIFEEIIHLGDKGPGGYGTTLLVEAEKQDPEIMASFERYILAHSGSKFLPIEHSAYAANHIANWLTQNKHLDRCDTLIKTATGSNANAISNLMFYFVDNGCKEAAPLAVSLLAQDEPGHRAYGCEILGKIGDKSHLSKLQTLANNDSTHKTVESPPRSGIYIKSYYVADACRTAIGKIKIRE